MCGEEPVTQRREGNAHDERGDDRREVGVGASSNARRRGLRFDVRILGDVSLDGVFGFLEAQPGRCPRVFDGFDEVPTRDAGDGLWRHWVTERRRRGGRGAAQVSIDGALRLREVDA